MRGAITFILFLFSFSLNAQLNWMKADSLRQMAFKDMQIRQQVDSVFKKYGRESQQWRSAWSSLESYDLLHNKSLKKIVAELKEYPGRNIVGEDAAHCFWTLVLHQDKDTAFQKKVIEMMKPAVAQKNAEPNDYAYLVDRYKINTGKKQIYGTQCGYDKKKKMYVPNPIEDRENVDKRRKEMELPSLDEYLKILNDTTRVKFH